MKNTIALILLLSLASGSLYGTTAEQPPPIPTQEQPEVLTRGPVHEAFAEPVNLQIQAGLVVSNQPPANIQEIPPTERPKGDQYAWVPGYWSWDGDRNNYIWVSACWRATPPNMSWVPGYWARVDEGWEWVAGFWTPADAQEIEYLPAPPVLEDVRPSSPPPSPDNIWVPSCQYWYQDHYIQRPGYWLAAHSDWVWVPSHYIWTPHGYIFLPGHWDYSLERRGVLFAPVYFSPSIYARSGFSYSPSIILDLGVLQLSLFTYPRYSHYYFGDYYDDAYLSVGIFPRYEVEQIHTWYDPIYVYDRWNHRDEPRWEENERQEYNSRHNDKDLRPPRTYQEMEIRQANSSPNQQRNNFQIAEPLATLTVSKKTSMEFERINTKEQQSITAQATEVSKFREERNRWESAPIAQKTVKPAAEQKSPVTQPIKNKEPVTAPKEQKGSVNKPADHTPAVVSPRAVSVNKPEKVKVPKSPIVGKSVDSGKPKPPNPVEERQQTSDTKEKDKGKDKGKDKNKDK